MEHIWINPGACRKEIASALGIHPNLVSGAVRELIDDNWIIEGKPRAGNPGRSPISLRLDRENRGVLAVSYGKGGVICALINAAGEIVKETRSDIAPREPGDLVDAIAQALDVLAGDYGGQLIGVGLADPGMVDWERGQVVRSSQFPQWHHVPLAGLLEEKTALPVLVENSTRTRAVAQHMITPELRQAGSSMLYLEYAEGIGCALITPDGLWRGAGFAGELGHVVLDSDGVLCGCGARGCLESLAGQPAMEAKAREMLTQGVNSILQGAEAPKARDIFEAALGGDRMARNLVEEIVSHLGPAVAFVIAALHPEYLVIGGESKAAIRCLQREMASAIHDRTLPEIASSVQVVEGREVHVLGLIGAAMMVFQKTIAREGMPCRPAGTTRARTGEGQT